jgi:hypothetical protein
MKNFNVPGELCNELKTRRDSSFQRVCQNTSDRMVLNGQWWEQKRFVFDHCELHKNCNATNSSRLPLRRKVL